jgi:alkane 1-monooxygenase
MSSLVVPNRVSSEQATAEPIVSAERGFALHLWAFFLPLLTTVYLLSGPHQWWVALLWTVPIWVLVAIDWRAPGDLRQPADDTPRWPFDVQVMLLVAIQIANHVLLGVMASKLSVATSAEIGVTLANFVAMHLVSGITAGYSGIVVAHELVHRRNRVHYFLGRLLLMFVWYEHFATEHVRGHHPRIGTSADPATARFGESFRQFLWRTVPAQFKSAWHLESVRLGDEHMSLFDRRMLRHRVLQGLVAQVAISAGYLYFFGWIALVFFLFQARMAIMLLEVVNYIEHWGLTRVTKAVTSLDSWDTDNWWTLYTLVGLSRHSDHHARASRPYQLLRRFEESPKMPSGYYGTIVLALLRNRRYQELATAELQRKRLGPFRDAGALSGNSASSPASEPASVGGVNPFATGAA